MPESVLEDRRRVLNYHGSGMCVMEMSHRSPVFQEILSQAEADLRTLMNIPENYKILFVQGGGTVQFAMVPMNLMKNGVACYVETGAWAKRPLPRPNGTVKSRSLPPPPTKTSPISPTVPIWTSRATPITSTSAKMRPSTAPPPHAAKHQGRKGSGGGPVLPVPLPPLRRQQIRSDLGRRPEERRRRHGHCHHPGRSDPGGSAEFVPTYLATRPLTDSLYNTPNCWSIYCCGKVFQYLLTNGGLEAVQRNAEKAAVLYDFLGRASSSPAPSGRTAP